jgi:hypothetical protein
VVAWASYAQDGDAYGIFARRFDSSGVGQGAELQVNAFTANSQTTPAVAMSGDGSFVVVWMSQGQDGMYNGVFAQRFDAVGGRKGAEFQVNLHTLDTQGLAEVAIDQGSGDFVVAWQSTGQDGASDGVFARHFDGNGSPRGTEFQVSTFTLGIEREPAVAMSAGGAVVTWQGDHDGSGAGIFAQRYLRIATLDVDGNGSADALTDGLLALRYLFGFRGGTLTTGAVGAGCTRCDAAAIEAYLATLL